MRGHLFEAKLEGADLLLVNAGAVAGFGVVGFGMSQAFDEDRLQGRAFAAEEKCGKLEDASGVGDDLDRLDAGDIVKEPAAACVHELGVALHLHQLQSANALARIESVAGVVAQEFFDGFRGAVEDHVNVGVASGPDIAEETAAFALCEGNDGVAQLVEGLAQGCAPELVPACAAAVAAAIGAPALHAVGAAPGGIVHNLALVFRRELGEEAAVIGEFDGLVVLRANATTQASAISPCLWWWP